MGQKVNPKSLRLKINRTWDSVWFAPKNKYSDHLMHDILIREAIETMLPDAGISKIFIERNNEKLIVNIFTSKPGLVIGPSGEKVEKIREQMTKKFGVLEIVVKEIKKPDLEASLVAASVARQVERRIPYRRAAKQAIAKAITGGAKGVKVYLGGRLNGVEIARSESFKEGNVPLHTLRSVIDYSEERANTIYGVIGIKVWIYKGDSFGNG